MTKQVLIASDSKSVRDEVKAVLSSREFTVREVSSGEAVLPAVAAEHPDLVICDFQVGNRGGMAITLDLRLEEGADRIEPTAILLLLDRRADVFLARRSDADGFLVKPLDPMRLRRAITALLAGEGFEDESYKPAASAAAPAVASS
ncbi:MAG TPA: response regulator [Acidimicrobiales bacterium]|jgi:DNA-binding response OmpR family regulator|nr:response regulator [Acidimicrobiales bacterium]